MGGVEINENAQVLDIKGNIIPNLFAAGEVTGGILVTIMLELVQSLILPSSDVSPVSTQPTTNKQLNTDFVIGVF